MKARFRRRRYFVPERDVFRQILKLGDEVKAAPDLKSFNEARNAIYEFQQAVEEFVAATQSGTRVAGALREGKIQPFLDSFKKVVASPTDSGDPAVY